MRLPDAFTASASGLQTLLTCPRKYCYQFLMHIRLSEDLEENAGRWLNPLVKGSTFHKIFESYVRRAVISGRHREGAPWAFDEDIFIEAAEDALARAEAEQPCLLPAVMEKEEDIREKSEAYLRQMTDRMNQDGFIPAAVELPFSSWDLPGNDAEASGEMDGNAPVIVTDSNNPRRIYVAGAIDRIYDVRPLTETADGKGKAVPAPLDGGHVIPYDPSFYQTSHVNMQAGGAKRCEFLILDYGKNEHADDIIRDFFGTNIREMVVTENDWKTWLRKENPSDGTRIWRKFAVQASPRGMMYFAKEYLSRVILIRPAGLSEKVREEMRDALARYENEAGE